jgi:histone acetyltransferase (RNA polymerase elongator complex component)
VIYSLGIFSRSIFYFIPDWLTRRDILKYVNRGCYTEDAVRAIRLLKDSCYKVDIHLMPDLPGSSPEKDRGVDEIC